MKPIFYEIKRILSSKFVIVMIVAIIGLSSLLAYESGSTFTQVSVPNTPKITVGFFLQGNNITMVGYSFNGYGSPEKNIHVDYTYNNITYSSTTSDTGFANVTFPFNPTKYGSTITVNYSYRAFRVSISSVFTYYVPANVTSSGLQIIPDIYNPSNDTKLGFLALYVGGNSKGAPNINFIITPINASNKSQFKTSYLLEHPEFNISKSGFVVTTIFPDVTYADHNYSYAVAAVQNGSVIQSAFAKGPEIGFVGTLTLYSPVTESKLEGLVNSGTSEILGFFIPILAVFSGYLTYGKDRTTGVIESVLKRPITRGGLISSRFLATSVAIVSAVIISMAIADLIIYHYFSMFLSTSFFLYFIWTYIVEGLAFLALVYVFSHLVSSQGALLGAAIAVFVVMDLFWSIIPLAVLAALGVSSSSNLYVQATVAFYYASPGGYSSLVNALRTNSIGSLFSISVNPALFGVTPALVITAGVLWIAIPFLIAYNLAVRRD
ncbi:MAG TPA: ABC transporter permease subunit [Thermoplasmataceae archaeon]|nr:ABC transporter permease [Thermoplasmatales archaeon AK]HLH86560.1 ABC transporter permease subunit [Thermoplasmataceae archaeon]